MSLWLISVPLEDDSHQRTWSILQVMGGGNREPGRREAGLLS